MTSRTRILLVVSLCLNAALTGIFIGYLVFTPPPPGPEPAQTSQGTRGEGPSGRHALSSLEPAERQRLRRELGRQWRTLDEERYAVRRARQAVEEVLQAKPYDVAAVANALDDLREAEDELKAQMQTRMLETVDTLPPEARADAVLALSGAEGHRSGRRGGPRRGTERRGD